jgi:creatinine amidohydrolase
VVEVCARRQARGAHLAPRSPTASASTQPPGHGRVTTTLRALAIDLVRDFHRQGMRSFVLISATPARHVRRSSTPASSSSTSCPTSDQRDLGYNEIRRRARARRGPDDSHAGEIETSRVLFLRPELVKGTSPAEWPEFPEARLVRDKRRHWPGGVWGDPSRASAEKGRRLTEIAVGRVIELIRELEDYRETASGGGAAWSRGRGPSHSAGSTWAAPASAGCAMWDLFCWRKR